jgi:hypothetical protein
MKTLIEQELTEETEISSSPLSLFPPVRINIMSPATATGNLASDVLAVPRRLDENEPSSREIVIAVF